MSKTHKSSGKRRGRIPPTDSGNATRLAKLHGDRIRYVAKWNKWLTWEGHRWVLDHSNVNVMELAKDVSPDLLRKASKIKDKDGRKRAVHWALLSGNRAKIAAMVELARGVDEIAINHQQLDQDPYLFGVANGVVDLRTGELRDGQPGDLMMMGSSVAFDAEAKAPRWRQAMKEWFPDEETRLYVKRLAGAALIGEQRDHLLVIHYGDGGNGKGTLVRAIAHTMGDYFVTPHKALLVEQRHDPHETEKAKLFRKRLAVAVETDHRQRLNEAEVKNLTGGDAISGRRMREDPWEFKPTHSLWLQTNYLPEIHGRDQGIWRRIRLVPWEIEFTDDKDPDLDQKLRDEAPGILNWLVEGALAYQEEGLDMPPAVEIATADYRGSEDILARFAIDSDLVFDQTLEIATADLTKALKEWCEAENIHSVPSAKDLAPWLSSNGAWKTRKRLESGKNPVTVWVGVGFKEDE
jgi:putative DNA primase/helicase